MISRFQSVIILLFFLIIVISRNKLETFKNVKTKNKNVLLFLFNNCNIAAGSTTFTLNSLKILDLLGYNSYFLDLYNSNLENLLNLKSFTNLKYDINFKKNIVSNLEKIIKNYKIDHIIFRDVDFFKKNSNTDQLFRMLEKNKVVYSVFVWSTQKFEIGEQQYDYLIDKSPNLLVSNYFLLDRLKQKYKNKKIILFCPLIDNISKKSNFRNKKLKQKNYKVIYNGGSLNQIVEKNHTHDFVLSKINKFLKFNNLSLEIYTKNKKNSFSNILYLPRYNAEKINLQNLYSNYIFSYIVRGAKYDEIEDISCKFIEALYYGILPLVPDSKIFKRILGDKYPYYLTYEDIINEKPIKINFDEKLFKKTIDFNYRKSLDFSITKIGDNLKKLIN